MAYTYHIHEARLRFQLGFLASRKVRKVLDDVHDYATRGATGGPYSGTGVGVRLANSIYKRGPIAVGWYVTGEVGSHLKYAASVERGARVHSIFPKHAAHHFRFGDRRRPQLMFAWRGRIVFTPHVPMSPTTIGRSHPGQRGKHFLRDAMIKAAAKHRLRFDPGPGSV